MSTDVVHMAWRGIEFPPSEMVEAGYTVVNATWDPLYIVDHYPRNNFTMVAPERVYGVSRWRLSHYNPDFPSYEPVYAPEGSDIIGFCMPWWEGRERHFLIMCPPRVAPLAARAWNPVAETDFEDFMARNRTSWQTIQRVSTPVRIEADSLAVPSAGVFHRQTSVSLATDLPGEVYYTVNGETPATDSMRYTRPFTCRETTTVRAVLYDGQERVGQVSELLLTHVDPIDNLALGKPVRSSAPSGPYFCVERLTDGGLGNLDFYLGYTAVPDPIQIVVDLEEPTELNQILVYEYVAGESFEDYTVEVSLDGKTYTQVGLSGRELKSDGSITHDFDTTRARYIRIVTRGHRGAVFRSFSKLIEVQAYHR